jgi:3-methyladenine DNA glycosylase AlkD
LVSVEAVLKKLKEKAIQSNLEGMQRYGITISHRLGVSIPDMRKIAKEIGKDHLLALELWKKGLSETQILAAMVDEPEKVTEKQMEDWVKDFDSWDVCDQVCMNLFEKTPFAWSKIREWSRREEEFVKRAAFALIACLAWHNKQASDQGFANLFPVIRCGALDGRNYVKKAVNWALRNIGKRNLNLNMVAIELATELQQVDSKSARWIGSDALKELESESVQRKLAKKDCGKNEGVAQPKL